ncbi:TRAP transporter substrate-binding protein [Propionivibrio sp.]|jgi:tripartite ATP-independent transporter DctP family solute receptor|uniref:TRAP transporter substrate-binding protein n=1 Tax=Propionivibrio sp. TaxID=2212460 RepID=UPI00272DF11F|nr:TRAP transporter substrate-binding protein [Propionivibrio sp.]
MISFRKSALSICFATLIGSVSATAVAQELKAADVHPEGYPTVVAVQNMGKKLEAATNGRIKLKMYPNMALGDEKSMIEQTQAGGIDILRTSLGPMGPVVPDVNVFNMPFVFRNAAHMRAVIDGPIGDEILKKISDSSVNLVGLAWMDGGTRNLYSKKAVRKPADLGGQKIRMMGNPLFVDTMNAMGGSGVSMGMAELFSSMQTGVVDGAENNEPTYVTQNHFTVAKYYNRTAHLIIPEVLVFSKAKFNKLSAEDQALVRKLAREAQLEQRKLWDEKVADSLAKMKAAGVTIVEDVDQPAFFKATQPVRDKYGAAYADLINRIQAVK